MAYDPTHLPPQCMILRACSAMCGTSLVYAAIGLPYSLGSDGNDWYAIALPCCYTLLCTELANAAIGLQYCVAYRGTSVSITRTAHVAIGLRASHAVHSTAVTYGARPYPVLSSRVLRYPPGTRSIGSYAHTPSAPKHTLARLLCTRSYECAH
eukprot:375847-Rhodomonas_salina.3